MQSGQNLMLEIVGSNFLIELPVSLQGNFGGSDHYTSSQQTRVYAEPDMEVALYAYSDSSVSGGGSDLIDVSISGYLVGLP
jgi:hypothetical protein